MSLLKRTTTAAATASSRALLHTTVQSYATPLSDFMGPTVTEVRTAATKVLRQPQPATTMSFATPYADAVGPRPAELHRLAAQPPRPFAVDIMATPSSLSFASPESDYTAPLAREQAWAAEVATMPTMLSFASPESDFVAGPTVDGGDRVSQAAGSWLVAALVDSPWLSFASPMADVQAAAPVPRHLLGPHATMLDVLAPAPEFSLQHWSFAHPEADFVYAPLPVLTNPDSEEIFAAIPRTLDAALQPSAQARVVTEARPPFRITHVNAAWEGLCGFTRAEAVGQTLSLLQGPLTEPGLLQHVEQQTAAHQATAVMLTNYTKDKRMFRNRLRVVPLSDNHGQVTHLLGVLEEVQASSARVNQAGRA